MRKKSKYNVVVVGAGVVGVEMLRVLRQRNFPVQDLRVLARDGRKITVDERDYEVEQISADSFKDADFALFAGTEGEKGAAVTFAQEAVKRGAIVIDNGADFRMEKDVPLVVPEVNGKDAKKNKGIIANPNCSTIQMVVAIAPIHRQAKVKEIIVSTYQAASGAGKAALKQLWDERENNIAKNDLAAAASAPIKYNTQSDAMAMPKNIAFNVFPHIGSFSDFDFTTEEWKMVKETHKILHSDKIRISATCVRVPVLNAHSEAVYLRTARPIEPEAVKELLRNSKNVV